MVRLQNGARPIPNEIKAILPRVSSALGVTVDRLPTIGISHTASQPVTLGLIRPMVLIPEGLPASLSADELRDVLIHECTRPGGIRSSVCSSASRRSFAGRIRWSS